MLRKIKIKLPKKDTVPFPYKALNETALIEIPSDSAIASTISKPTYNQTNNKQTTHSQFKPYHLQSSKL